MRLNSDSIKLPHNEKLNESFTTDWVLFTPLTMTAAVKTNQNLVALLAAR